MREIHALCVKFTRYRYSLAFNVKKCVKFTHGILGEYTQWVNTPKPIGWIHPMAFKRTETAFLGVFPSTGYNHTKHQSKRLETGFKRQQTLFTTNSNKAKQQKTTVIDPR